jgi:thioredoxin reductase
LNVGVLQTGQGNIPGTWAGGVVAEKLADDMAQRNAIIVAFQAAADASTSVSKSFAKKGDVKASRFYAKQARSLRDQMD